MKIIDGKQIAKELNESTKKELLNESLKGKIRLSVVLVGEDSASKVYVKNKEKLAQKLGIESDVLKLNEDISQKELEQVVNYLNLDETVDGILVQFPLPSQLDESKIMNMIDPKKDVDGLNEINSGLLYSNQQEYYPVPCTPTGIVKLINSTGISIDGKNAVIIGRSQLVGKPIAMMLLNLNATVTIAHSHTKNLKELAKTADILIVATGIAKMINHEYIKSGAVVIDVGMDRDENGKLVGDVDFEDVQQYTEDGFITPVPGGVGPMTVACLMSQVVDLKLAKLMKYNLAKDKQNNIVSI